MKKRILKNIRLIIFLIFIFSLDISLVFAKFSNFEPSHRIPHLLGDFPNSPSNPTPSVGMANIPIDQNFSWTGGDPDGDPVLYIVNLKTEEDSSYSEICVIPYTTDTSIHCNPSSDLLPGKHYYWYVTASDGNLITNSQVWDFYTVSSGSNSAPYKPNNPTPSDGSTNIPLLQNFSWIGGDPDGDTVNYLLYIKAEGGTYIVSCSTSTSSSVASCNPSIDLEYDTHYYWYVRASDGEWDELSDTWDFYTESSRHWWICTMELAVLFIGTRKPAG